MLSSLISKIFNISNEETFNEIAINVFKFQYENIPIYRSYIDLNRINIDKINHFKEIPFLPIQFFRSHNVIPNNKSIKKTFLSSGTSKEKRSKHQLHDTGIYNNSFINTFKLFYGDLKDWTILALLPSYQEQGDSSLIYMIDKLIKLSSNKKSRYLDLKKNNIEVIFNTLKNEKVLLIGVSYALLDLSELRLPTLKNWTIMETGGMKGRRKELIRDELHKVLKSSFDVKHIHSEYGMTELLSQAYSLKNGLFNTPPWMKVLIRDLEDPYNFLKPNYSGGINIIDLANIYSCSFIETQDIGKKHENNSFEVLGRFDNSEIRGCNLLSVN